MDSQDSEHYEQELKDSIPEQRLPKLPRKVIPFLGHKPSNQNPQLLYAPIPCSVFFDRTQFINDQIPVYTANSSINSNQSQTIQQPKDKTVLICFHGAGQSAMTFCQIAKTLKNDFIIISYDMRQHGSSKIKKSQNGLSLIQLIQQGKIVCKYIIEKYSKSPIYFIGHSLGGALSTKLAIQMLSKGQISSQKLMGICLIDAFEGLVKTQKQSMLRLFKYQPKSFKSVEAAISYTHRSQTIRRIESARASVPSQITSISSQNEDSEVRYEWKVKLQQTQHYWNQWFDGLTNVFLNLPLQKKILLTTSIKKLDDNLIHGLQEMKFEIELFDYSGHFIHEDQYEGVSRVILKHFSWQYEPSKEVVKK